MGHRSASESQHCVHVDIEGLTPALFGYVEESTGDRCARGVHQNIDSPPKGVCFCDGANAILSPACICLDVKGLSAMRLGSSFQYFE
jgi:hypothetical protein